MHKHAFYEGILLPFFTKNYFLFHLLGFIKVEILIVF